MIVQRRPHEYNFLPEFGQSLGRWSANDHTRPMPLSSLMTFVLVAGLLTITPGLDTALVLRAAIAHGPARATATAGGILTGALIWGVAAAIGASTLLTASETAYTVLRWTGAAYLIWLGLRLLRNTTITGSSVAGEQIAHSAAAGWRAGLATRPAD